MPFLSMNSSNYQEEIPITSTPIFEGHLYIRTIKRQWQWRLFRFDGSSFTCLSTKKVKSLPQYIQDSSLLLMTPKDKDKRIIKDEKLELKYYQLPEWTIDISSISSISILKRKKHSNHASKCFSIRTFDSNQFILKAQKQKDLERWLFVLTKMWKFTQTIQDHMQQYYIHQPTIPIQSQQLDQNQIDREKENDIVDDNTPLVHSMNKSASQTLSNEKIKVIEEWRKSLAELMANDPTIRLATPPPIEPIPDDDTMSIFTDMTSVSKRHKNSSMIKRKTSKRLTATCRSIRRNKSNSISPSTKELPLEGRPTLKKKRSDDVRNWMNDKRKVSHIQVDPFKHDHASTSPEIVQYMNFFQDALTICDDDACPYEHSYPQQQIGSKLKYHTSVRGKKLVQINHNNESSRRSRVYEEGDEDAIKNLIATHKEGEAANITRRASMNQLSLLQNEQQFQQKQQLFQLQQQQYLFDQQKMKLLSPLHFLSLTSHNMNQDYNQEEEDMSLADLQKSLRKVSIHHTRSPSASSIHDKYVYPSSIVAPAIPPHQYHRPASFYLPHQQLNNMLITSCPSTQRKKK